MSLNEVILDHKGNVLEKDFTYASAISTALLNLTPGENPTPEVKIKRAKLVVKLQRDDPSLTSEDISLIKEAVGINYAPWVVYQIYNLLDPNSVK
jgi:hypothetical protein